MNISLCAIALRSRNTLDQRRCGRNFTRRITRVCKRSRSCRTQGIWILAIQLFCMLPSSNVMGAEHELERGSRWARKGACQWNRSGQHPGWLATTPAEHGCLSDALQFLIANPELEFELSPKRISNLKFSNRKFMTIFQSENRAASEFRRLQPPNSSEKTVRSPKFPTGTAHPTRIGILSDHRESKELSCDPAKILRTAKSPKFLIGTFDISEKHSNHRPKQISNRNKIRFLRPPRNIVSAFSSLRVAAQIRGSADA